MCRNQNTAKNCRINNILKILNNTNHITWHNVFILFSVCFFLHFYTVCPSFHSTSTNLFHASMQSIMLGIGSYDDDYNTTLSSRNSEDSRRHCQHTGNCNTEWHNIKCTMGTFWRDKSILGGGLRESQHFPCGGGDI